MAEVKIDVKLVTAAAEAAIKQFERTLKQTDSSVDNLNKDLQKTGSTAAKAGNTASQAWSTFKGVIGAQVFGVAFRAISSGIGDIVKSAMELEQVTTQFEVLTGSTEKASNTLKDLQDFAASTPFQFPDIAKSAAALIGFGTSAENVRGQLQRIGDVAAASNVPLKDLSVIFGQIQSEGKLTGERLRQLQERAIPIGPALARSLGIAEEGLKKAVSQGLVTTEVFVKAFNSLSDAGGPAFQGLVKQSRTLSGVISTLKDNFTIIATNVAQNFLPALKIIGITASQLIQSVGGVNGTVKNFSSTITEAAVTTIKFIANSINPLYIGIVGLKNTFEITVQAIGGGVSFLASIVTQAFSKIIGGIRTVIEALPESLVPEGWTTSLVTAEEFFKTATESLVDTSGDFAGEVVNDFNDISKASEGLISEETLVKFEENLNKTVEFVTTKNEEIKASDNSVRDNAIANQTAITDDLKKQVVERQKTLSLYEQQELKRKETAESVKNSIFRFFQSEETKADKKQSDLEIANTKDTLNTLTQLQSVHSREAFEIGKAAAIAKATIDGIAAVQAALTLPPPFGFIQAAAVGVLTASNVSKIASQSAPRFEQGGIVPGTSFSGDQVTARVNSGEMILNRTQQGNLFNMINSGGSSGLESKLDTLINLISGKDERIIVNIGEKNIVDTLRSQLRSGRSFA